MIEETGSELAAQLWDAGFSAVSSILSYPEGQAALAAAARSERLDASGHRGALIAFDELQRELTSIAVDAPLAREAGILAERHGLRGYDAVHLATALAAGEPPTVVTWDRDLATAASRSGCPTAPPLLE